MRASIVIPTFNRLDQLQTVVAAVQRQNRPPDIDLEVVVVDDGSSDGTADWLETQIGDPTFKAIKQRNSGPARARNRGVEAATGDLILFLGDDTEPQPGWLGAHLEEHRLFGNPGPLAVLGYTSFSPDIESPFLRFINEYGAQFGYLLIEDPREVPFNFFYTSNISLPRSELVRLGGFREDFPAAAWEDIEFAYRAVGDGLKIHYQPRARTLHRHCIRPRTFCSRQRTSGRSAAIFAKLHPELEDFLGFDRSRRMTPLGRLRRSALWLLVELGERVEGLVPRRVYQDFLDLCYQEGLAEGLQGE
ncbi:MAG: glycosyltransferase [Thermoanaerobaculales bacterium]|jgi:GT2 family glycosyltransferase|nr:glycosyltransferase [Thermoanaerobaculales bacterium]